ncbi:MAG TPA: hypothetical protein VMR06_03645 [Dokdonella sp.]|uniref:hypothetical protein n=1 Tax=Dokdonella sp. TaxID=2291710 RepID=UPI002C2B2FC6|nr:hypothetical protein [Dokdonella sp.]HUD41072.1 hypothetical protein [Dokdonella sp.]
MPTRPLRLRTAATQAHAAALAGVLLAATAGAAQAGTAAMLRIGGGTLYVPATIANADVLAEGGTLAGDGSVLGAVVLGTGGALAPGPAAGAGTISAAALTWQPGAGVRHRLGSGDADSDHTALSGTLTRNGSGAYLFAFDDADTLPTAGATYTLMSFAAQSGFSASDFSYSYSGAAPALNGEFMLTDGALLFHVTSLPVGLQSFSVD